MKENKNASQKDKSPTHLRNKVDVHNSFSINIHFGDAFNVLLLVFSFFFLKSIFKKK